MSRYVRPATLDEALALLAEPGARPFGGGTDLAGQVSVGLSDPDVFVDLQSLSLDYVRADGDGLAIGATTTLSTLIGDALVAPYAVVASAASKAASPLLRNVGTVGGNLCQWTRCWYFRGVEWTCWLGGGDTCYAQIGDHRKHNAQPGDCISAHPSDLAPALAACGARVVVRSSGGARELELLDLYRRPTADNRSLLVLEPGELVTEVRLTRPPDASSYQRLGEREAFSFPLVSVAAVRRGAMRRLVAAGVANIPLELDPDDPVRELPGNPQTAWKRAVVEALARRALDELEEVP